MHGGRAFFFRGKISRELPVHAGSALVFFSAAVIPVASSALVVSGTKAQRAFLSLVRMEPSDHVMTWSGPR